MSDLQASVTIGFKDWGLDRLERCITSTLQSFGDIPVEVIVSDYGSAGGEAVAQTARTSGVGYLRTETDGTWSRSRALNAGFSVAKGRQFFATERGHDLHTRSACIGVATAGGLPQRGHDECRKNVRVTAEFSDPLLRHVDGSFRRSPPLPQSTDSGFTRSSSPSRARIRIS